MSIRPTCALVLFCVVQGCERFAFLAMLPLFVLYLHHRHVFTEPSALLLLGVMSALSYVGGLPAGILADRKLGALGALLLGGALLTVGYGALALDYPTLLWPALASMTVGHSLFKPSISTLFGSLFDVADVRRERSFLWQHLAVNLAGLVGPLCGEWLRVGNRWDRLFLLSAVVMCIGCSVLVAFARVLPDQPPQRIETASLDGAVRMNRERWIAVCWLCGLSIVFWLTAQQAGGSLSVFAESHTQRSAGLNGGDAGRISPAWLTGYYLLLSLAELLLSPLGLSLVSHCTLTPNLASGWPVARGSGSGQRACGRHRTRVGTMAASSLLRLSGALGSRGCRTAPLTSPSHQAQPQRRHIAVLDGTGARHAQPTFCASPRSARRVRSQVPSQAPPPYEVACSRNDYGFRRLRNVRT